MFFLLRLVIVSVDKLCRVSDQTLGENKKVFWILTFAHNLLRSRICFGGKRLCFIAKLSTNTKYEAPAFR